MLSVSRSDSPEAHAHTRFAAQSPATVGDLCTILTTRVWSPVVWKDGARAKANFQAAGLVALDFDDGRLTLEECVREMNRLQAAHIVGTTKSHRVAKGTCGAVDRFRLILPSASVCTDLGVYEENMREFIRTWGGDLSCADGGRFFFPCREIVSVKMDKRRHRIHWNMSLSTAGAAEARQAEMMVRLQKHKENGTVPLWISQILRGDEIVEPGRRHATTYKLAARLTACGWSKSAIMDAILKTPLAQIGADDVRRAIANGVNAAR
jgi:hypothetical protein